MSHSLSQAIGLLLTSSLFLAASSAHAEIKVASERVRSDDASPTFKFRSVPAPVRNDAASKARFVVVDGRRDPNGGDLSRLHDGRLPAEEDAPTDNFFFTAGTDGGRLLVDLGNEIEIAQVNTYSWHGSTRGPQVYRLFASDGKAGDFNAEPKREIDPAACGWKLLAKVDTRPEGREAGGQYGVSIAESGGSLGTYRYLLFDIARTEDRDGFGNTFFSEVDVIDRKGPALELVAAPVAKTNVAVVEIDGGKYQATIDTSETPDLTAWANRELVPMLQEWYPKLVKLLPSEGYEAPRRFSIVISTNAQGVAATSGTRVRCAAKWFRQNLAGEAKGAVFHEVVHVVQQYGRGPRQPGSTRAPGWLTEGITDYIRWYHFEPKSGGAEIGKRGFDRARYDGSYRITANFLNWVSEKHDTNFVMNLNATIREGRYNDETWKKSTGQTATELDKAWRDDLAKKLGVKPSTPATGGGASTNQSNTTATQATGSRRE